jgi:hypothetical protein
LHADRQATEKKRPQVEKILLPPAARLKNEERLSRLSDTERAMLMGGACAKASGWSPKKA